MRYVLVIPFCLNTTSFASAARAATTSSCSSSSPPRIIQLQELSDLWLDRFDAPACNEPLPCLSLAGVDRLFFVAHTCLPDSVDLVVFVNLTTEANKAAATLTQAHMSVLSAFRVYRFDVCIFAKPFVGAPHGVGQ